jgi:hypothetical protein
MKMNVPGGVYMSVDAIEFKPDDKPDGLFTADAAARFEHGSPKLVESGVRLCFYDGVEPDDDDGGGTVMAEGWLTPDEADELAAHLRATAKVVRERLAIGTIIDDGDVVRI